jgi:hypothetical protein
MTDVAVPSAAPAAAFIGQATAVEQSRAVAEVQAAVVVAQQVPRSVTRSLEQMREAFAHRGLAERSFYSYKRAGSTITGPSIHFATELARVWGNIQYGIAELRRDDVKGESELIAFAWDVQANIRSSTTFIVKHARDTQAGRKPLTDLRDVYENNANNGARRVREMIFRVVPAWFTDEAKDRAYDTLRDGGGAPLPRRIMTTIAAFADSFGVDEARLADRVGKPSGEWSEVDLANLTVLGGSLRRGELTVEEEFPKVTTPITAAELTGKAPTAAPEAAQDTAAVDPAPTPAARPGKAERPANGVTKGRIKAAAKTLGLDDDRPAYLAMLEAAIGHPVTSSNDLTQLEAEVAVAYLVAKAEQAPDSVTAGETDDFTGLDVSQLRELAQDRAKALGWSKPEFLRAAEDEYAQPFDDLDAEQLRRFVTGLTFARIRRPQTEEES